jgi:hypothetical protein
MSNIPRKEGSLLKFENLELRNDKEIVEIAIKSHYPMYWLHLNGSNQKKNL